MSPRSSGSRLHIGAHKTCSILNRFLETGEVSKSAKGKELRKVYPVCHILAYYGMGNAGCVSGGKVWGVLQQHLQRLRNILRLSQQPKRQDSFESFYTFLDMERSAEIIFTFNSLELRIYKQT